MTMYDDLKKFYEQNQKLINDLVDTRHPSVKNSLQGPHLIDPQNFAKSKKLLVYGQETYGWDHTEKIEYLMKLTKQCQDEHNTPIFQFICNLEKELGYEPRTFAWSNIIRFDNGEEEGSRSLLKNDFHFAIEICKKTAPLFVGELNILKPQNVLFLSGPYYDHCIKAIFEDAEFVKVEGFELRQLAFVKHPLLPNNTLRTYHPGYLSRNPELKGEIINYIVTLFHD